MPARQQRQKHRRCNCPIWVDGTISGAEIRKSLDMRDWQRAQDLIRTWEAEGTATVTVPPVPIAEARAAFVADAKARNLREPTLKKYRQLFDDIEAFCKLSGLLHIKQIELPTLRAFHAAWKGEMG